MKCCFSRVLLSILVIITLSCQEEDLASPQDETTNLEVDDKRIDVKLVDFEHGLHENIALAKQVKSIQKPNSLEFGRTSTSYGFSLLEDQVQIIEQDGFTTYTFLVQRDTMDYTHVENYVYLEMNDGSYSQYLLAYEFYFDEFGDYLCNTDFFEIEEINDPSLLDTGRQSCYPEYVQVGTETVCTVNLWCGSNSHILGDDTCKCGTTDLTCEPAGTSCEERDIFGWTSCAVGGGDSGNNPSNNPPNNGGGGGPNTNPDDGDDDDIVFAFPLNIREINQINNCLNSNQQPGVGGLTMVYDIENVTATPQQFLGVYSYLITENNCSDEAKEFAELALDAFPDGEVDYEEEILIDETFENNERLKCVYDKFKSTDNTISNYLENFLGERPVAHLKLTADSNFQANHPNGPDAGAATMEPQNYLIEISFNVDPNSDGAAQNYPTVVLASDLMHEMLHAELYRKLLSVAQEPNIPWSEEFVHGIKNHFETLSEYYLRWKYGNPSQPAATSQHQLMADYYREMIIEGLKDFDNNAQNDAFYDTLSWSGLVGTVAWNNLSPLQQQNITDEFENIVNNQSYDCSN